MVCVKSVPIRTPMVSTAHFRFYSVFIKKEILQESNDCMKTLEAHHYTDYFSALRSLGGTLN